MELQAIIGSPRNQCLRLSSCVCQLHGQRCCCTAGVSSQQRPQLFAGAVLKYMTRRGSSVLRSWPRMMPCSSPLSFENAIPAARARSAAATRRVVTMQGDADRRAVLALLNCGRYGAEHTAVRQSESPSPTQNSHEHPPSSDEHQTNTRCERRASDELGAPRAYSRGVHTQ